MGILVPSLASRKLNIEDDQPLRGTLGPNSVRLFFQPVSITRLSPQAYEPPLSFGISGSEHPHFLIDQSPLSKIDLKRTVTTVGHVRDVSVHIILPS